MTLTFAESFWGDKNNGFEIIYHNFKEGVLASKEFSDFVATVYSTNELAGNNFKKLITTKTTSATAASSVGSFTPLSLLLKTYAEHMSNHYGETAKRLQDLMGKVHKYGEQQKERQKQVRDTEAPTEQLMKNVRELSLNLQRCKEEYHRRSMEFEKARRAETPPQQKELDRLEARVRKSREDYRQIIDKFNSTREDFERKMNDSCVRLQEIEEAHLDQMKSFIASYFEVIENARKLITKAEEDSRANIAELSREKLLEIFIKTRTTGNDRPVAVEFEEPDFSQLPPLAITSLPGAVSQPDLIPIDTPNRPPATQTVATAPTSSLNNFWNIVKPRAKTKQNKRSSKDVQAANETDPTTDPTAPDGDSLSNETPEPSSEALANSGGFQALESNGFSSLHNNGDGFTANDEDDSFDSDSDDGVSAFRQLKIKEKDESNGGTYGTVEDISQIMRNVTLNPIGPGEPKQKRTMKKSVSMGGSNNRFFVTGSQSSFELNRSPLSTSMTPEDINKAFDPLYVSPTPSSMSSTVASAPRPNTPATSQEIQSLFSAFPTDQPSSSSLVPPPVAERRTQTPKPPSPPVSPMNFPPPAERVASPTPKNNVPPVAPPPVARVGPPPPPPARTRFTVADPQAGNSVEKNALRRQPESASAVLASIPEVSVTNSNSNPALSAVLTTTTTTLSASPAPVNGSWGASSNNSTDETEEKEIQEAGAAKKHLSQSTSALPIIRPRSHTPQAISSSGTAFISPPHSSSGDETSVSQSPMTATSIIPMISNEASSPSFASSTPTRQTPANEVLASATVSVASNVIITTTGTTTAPTSRGPSPYDGALLSSSSTQSENVAIPIAVSFSESIDAVCRGLESSQCCGLKVAGRLTVSFPAGFARAMAEIARGGDSAKSLPHPLMFRVSPVRGLHQVHHYRQLVAQIPSPLADSLAYRFEMPALAEHLAKQYETHRTNLHFSIDILKYELRPENCMHASPLAVSYRLQQAFGSETPPGKAAALHLVVRHRGVSMCPVPLKNPTVSLTVDNLENVTSTPPSSQFESTSGRISWQLPDLTASSPDFLINADLRFKDTARSLPSHLGSPLSVTFDGDGHLFSALKFDLVSIAHYRMSLFRKLFKSGRYDVEPDGPSQLAYV